MTGDVLPCFDASTMILPEDASCIITVPITLDIASNHGVIVASQREIMAKSYSVSLVDNLLQKPSMQELVKYNAILDDGRTLLDTGIIAARGQAWVELVKLSCSCEPLILELLKSRKEASTDVLSIKYFILLPGRKKITFPLYCLYLLREKEKHKIKGNAGLSLPVMSLFMGLHLNAHRMHVYSCPRSIMMSYI